MAEARYLVIIVTDSRAIDIKDYLDDWGDIDLHIVGVPSAGIEAAIEYLIEQRRDATPNLVLVLNGICDVLAKHQFTHKYFMLHDNVEETVSHYMEQVKRGKELLVIFYDQSRHMFAPVTGADIADYNNPQRKNMSPAQLQSWHYSKTPDPLQNVMNQAVLEINSKIGPFNRRSQVISPYTASYVHRHYGNSYHHSYQFTSDGCHLTREGKIYWASQIKKAIDKTRAMPFNPVNHENFF